MQIALDTTELKKIKVRVDRNGKIIRRSFSCYADAALVKIEALTKGERPRELAVVAGPGAWSATRTGVALINALSYAWQVPLAAITAEAFANNTPLAPGVRQSAIVRYNAPPNITKKRPL